VDKNWILSGQVGGQRTKNNKIKSLFVEIMEKNFKLEINGQTLEIKLNNWAEQADASALIQLGETIILATCVMSKKEREGCDFLPLTVEYEEKYYAAGKIYGSRYLRREGRSSNEAILNGRLIDRAIRPLFPQWLRKEIQIVLTCLSWDGKNDPDILGLLGASLVLSISNIPWQGPVGAVRISQLNGDFVLNSSHENKDQAKLELVLSGIKKNQEILINMMEGQADEMEEKNVSIAIEKTLPELEKIINFQEEIVKEIGKEKLIISPPEKDEELEIEVQKFLEGKLEKILFEKDKKEQTKDLDDLKKDLIFFIKEKYQEEKKEQDVLNILEEKIEKTIKKGIIKTEKRTDSRGLNELRKITAKTSVLPRAHGSGLFSRGMTRALSVLTLGPPGDQQLFQEMEVVGKKRFMHHYNFPPYSVGEIKQMRGPGRREIGHGMLAEKALKPLIPVFEEFPYTIRIVSEILSSNGSTSMAAVSSSCLALMDAGVPIKRPCAGISIGLIEDNNKQYLLTDIQGPEDHYGEMDLKIAGTKQGITAIQMDVKNKGISSKLLSLALEKAKKARQEILAIMEKEISSPRTKLSPFAPKILTLQISPDKIKDVIGPGGKMIHSITDEFEVTIDVEDTGMVFITAESKENAEKAKTRIKDITREVQTGELFQGKITRILSFGAFAEILPKQEGLIHISELDFKRVEKVEDIVKIGDIVPVKIISIDEQGRINLSLKQAKQDG